MHGSGTEEPWFFEDASEFQFDTGRVSVATHWRKPLRIDEVSRMADTPEVQARPGRP